MTSRDQVVAVHLLTKFLHDEFCAFDAAPGTVWSDGHMRVDRARAARLRDRLVEAGLIQQPEPGGIDADFLAVP